jgi:Secretion system C-terminal sorting domain
MKTLYLIVSLLLIGTSAISQQQLFSPAVIQKPVYFDISPPLRDMANLKQIKADVTWKDGIVRNNFNNRHQDSQTLPNPGFTDTSLQDYFGKTLTDTTIQNFEGLGSGSYIPPDTYGDIGPNHYFQVVNASYAIYDKAGDKILGPLPSSSVWNGMPNNVNSGDAVVVYDENANRWLFSQFSLPYYPNGPFYQMIAVSQTPDPTGSWFRYQYTFTSMPDYPKFGTWPDGYYMSCNRFSAGSGGFAGTGAAAFDRTKMLAGDLTAQMIYFTLSSSNEAYSFLPSDCDGAFPPAGTPNYFTYEDNQSPQHLGILEFHADWTTPANSTFGNLLSVPVTSFNSNLSPGIPQKGTTVRLATLSDRLMYRLQFRKFNDHWSMVCNHSVNAGAGVAGIRWYELRKTTGAWTVYQQATYAPADNNYRWMGSMAMDTAGSIAIGYSISSSSMYPSIRYTGRLRSDPLNQMTITERGIMSGGGCQTSSSQRWGDYSSMTVDPSSPTTFWFTTEYYSITSSSSWQTRVASFTFANVYSTYAAANPSNLCAGDTSQLNSVAYGGSGNYTYSWTSVPIGFTSNLKNPKVAPGDTTTYIVAVGDGNQTHHDTTRVSVVLPPVVFAGNDTTVCAYTGSIQLHGIASNYKLFEWGSSGNGSFSNHSALNTIYIFGSHDYLVDSVDLYLVAFANSPCQGRVMSTKHVTLDPCTGIQVNTTNDQNVILKPNPARESVTIIINGLENKPALMTVTDMKGQTLFSEEIPGSGKFVTRQLDLKEYPSGMYYIKVRTDTKVITKKLVVSP